MPLENTGSRSVVFCNPDEWKCKKSVVLYGGDEMVCLFDDLVPLGHFHVCRQQVVGEPWAAAVVIRYKPQEDHRRGKPLGIHIPQGITLKKVIQTSGVESTPVFMHQDTVTYLRPMSHLPSTAVDEEDVQLEEEEEDQVVTVEDDEEEEERKLLALRWIRPELRRLIQEEMQMKRMR